MTTNENPASTGMLDGADSEIARGDAGINNTTVANVQASATDTVANPRIAVDFLTALFQHATHPIYLCSLANSKDDPNTGPEKNIRTRDAGEMTTFVTANNDPLRATYFCISTVDGAKRNKKTARELPALWADIDFKDIDEKPADILRKVKALPLPPSIIVGSGHGYHCYWLFKEPWPTTEVERIEAALKLLADLVGGDMQVTQIAALMRVPGSINTKNAGNRRAVELVEQNELTFELDDLEQMLSEKSPIILRTARPPDKSLGESSVWRDYVKGIGQMKPAVDVEKHLASMAFMGGGEAGIHKTQLRVTASLLNAGKSIDEVVKLVLKATRIAAGDYGLRWNWGREENGRSGLRNMCETWLRKHPPDKNTNASNAAAARPVGEPDWRERRNNGSPLPSMHNARLAINVLGIKCSRDTFHNKTLFGFADDKIKHELQSIIGEVTDDGVIALRQLMSDKFGFDLEDKATRDAVKSLALQHCFNPVCDLIDKAEADWDGVERLGGMAVTHFNCEDTPLNCAFMRKTMIAMVARARMPGCKFDTITVLESAEGYNKSTALRVLAGDDNFSDEAIIGKQSREVQEQLAEIWVHENADLAGMKKAEVETVKAFASRTTDIARAAFAHFIVKQRRHSIEVGSTNSEEYLQSQTGNRRFWPLRILKAIDIDFLKRDRLQLIGEAARCQSAGESITLDESMWPDAGVQQDKRRIKHPWEAVLAVIHEYHKIADASTTGYMVKKILHYLDGEERVSSRDLLTYVLGISAAHQTTAHTMQLSATMKRLGWERTENKITIEKEQVRGFFRKQQLPAVNPYSESSPDDGIEEL